MTTIFLHHHAEDVLAAEVIGGVMLSVGPVAVTVYPPGPQRVVPLAVGERIENLVLWTPAAEDEPMMAVLLQSLAVRRAPCTVLVHPDADAPTRISHARMFPLFDRQSSWLEYRRALRALVAGADDPQPERWSGMAALAQMAALQFPALLSSGAMLPVAAVGGVLMWALLR